MIHHIAPYSIDIYKRVIEDSESKINNSIFAFNIEQC